MAVAAHDTDWMLARYKNGFFLDTIRRPDIRLLEWPSMFMKIYQWSPVRFFEDLWIRNKYPIHCPTDRVENA